MRFKYWEYLPKSHLEQLSKELNEVFYRDLNNLDTSKITSDIFIDPIYKNFEKELKKIPERWDSIPIMKESIEKMANRLGFVKGQSVDYRLGTKVKGIYDKIGFNVQFGNKAFFQVDLVNFQHLYNRNLIDEVLYVCLSKEAEQQSYSSSLVNLDKCINICKVFDGIFTFPIYFIEIQR
jgi:mRNA-degrading endonuclease RelE of RelBE toxin-antitoxin system